MIYTKVVAVEVKNSDIIICNKMKQLLYRSVELEVRLC